MKSLNILSEKFNPPNIKREQQQEDFELVFFERKPGYRNFSLELHFDSVRKNLPPGIQYNSSLTRFINKGILRKMYNLFEPIFKKKGQVNHITGDVHYIGIFMPRETTLLTIHDVNLMYNSRGLKKWFMQWFWLRLPVSRAKLVSVVSQATKEELLKYVNCDPDKIRVVHSPIAPIYYYSARSFNKEKPVILQVGTKPNKNLKRVVEALKGIPCTLDIIGKPQDDVLDLLAWYGIDYNWEEHLSNEEVLQKYIDCDMLVFASTMEGFGMPVAEAQTVGRPVVTSDILSIPEVAGDAACMVNPYDVADIRRGIKKVIEDDAYRDQLIADGRENARRFAASTITAQYVELYREILHGNQ